MRSMMRPEDYFSPEVHRLELEHIYRRLWILAAIRPMLNADGAFRTLSIANTPVALRNCGGRIRAFLNICKHRGARLHQAEFGSSALVCPYHGWSYNDNLHLDGLPRNKTLFQFSDTTMAEIRLTEFAVREVGALIFVNLSAEPIPIHEQFNEQLLAVLATSSAQMDNQFAYTRFECAFNWKLGIENIKDPLHVEVLHKGTFPDTFDTRADREVVPSMNHAADPASTWREVGVREVSNVWDVPMESGDRDWHSLVTRVGGERVYRGIHLFPNVNLMIVAGAIFSIQIYNPLDSRRTELQMLCATTRPVGDFAYKPLVLWEHLKSDMTVLRQDVECLEQLQAGLHAADFQFRHGAYESGLIDFHVVCKSLCTVPSGVPS